MVIRECIMKKAAIVACSNARQSKYRQETEDLTAFLETTPLLGMNVTIPYKKAVVPFCARLSGVRR